jgi:hypothetical protein
MPDAASVRTNDAAQAATAMEEYTREEFTGVTLQPAIGILAGSPAVGDRGEDQK